jgi:alkaline phosphatase
VNAASIMAYDAPQKLYIQSWPNIGLSDTSTTSRWVTDSAAGMTAIVTGQKTENGLISQGPDAVRGKQDGTPLKTILEHAEERGLSTGVVSNVTITDATPGACYAHVNDRRKWGDIFLQIFTPRFGDGVDIVFGPGRQRIYEQVKQLGKDPDAAAQAATRVVHESLKDVPPDSTRALAIIDGEIDLEDASMKAIAALAKNPKGFFLMIESDAHTNKPDLGLGRLVAFDNLIRKIVNRVDMDETLVLFTADHSFDLRLRGGKRGDPLLKDLADWHASKPANPKEVRLAALRIDDAHTGEEVLVAAQGPGSEMVRGFMPNTHIFHIMMSAWGWQKPPSSQQTVTLGQR